MRRTHGAMDGEVAAACISARREGQGRRGLGAAVVAAGRRDLQRDVDVGADFRRFHREKAAASRAMPTLDTRKHGRV